MTLIDINASKDLLGQINVHTSTAGGSAANTIAGTASLGMSSGQTTYRVMRCLRWYLRQTRLRCWYAHLSDRANPLRR